MEVVKGKVTRKRVSIKTSQVTKKNLVSKYNKFQLWVAWLIRVQLADRYNYLFRIDYKGMTRLRPNDVVVNSEGVIFLVIQESNRLAMLVTKDAYMEKPKMYGTLTILEK